MEKIISIFIYKRKEIINVLVNILLKLIFIFTDVWHYYSLYINCIILLLSSQQLQIKENNIIRLSLSVDNRDLK